MKIKKHFNFILLVLMASSTSYGRVFDMNRETFASYFSGNYGTSKIANSANKDESSATTFNDSVSTNTGGEFGFLYTSKYIGWRFGFEVLKPPAISPVASAGGTDLYTVKSDLLVYIPKLGIDITLFGRGSTKYYFGGYAGTASITMTNTYSLVTATPPGDHTVTAKGAANLMGGHLGLETLMADTTTFVLELGYRVLNFTELKYAKDVTTFSSPGAGAVVSGDIVKDTNANNRTIDFTGYYAAVGFRFYL